MEKIQDGDGIREITFEISQNRANKIPKQTFLKCRSSL